MVKCKDHPDFIRGGTVPAGKDGFFIWQERDIKGGLIWLAKPVKEDDDCEEIIKGNQEK